MTALQINQGFQPPVNYNSMSKQPIPSEVQPRAPLSHGVLSSYSQDRLHHLQPLVTPAINDDMDFDSLPFSRQAQPSMSGHVEKRPLFKDDPLLCVTPEKTCFANKSTKSDRNIKASASTGNQPSGTESHYNIANSLSQTDRSRKDLRVTFDQNVDIRHVSPDPKQSGSDVSVEEETDILDIYGVVSGIEELDMDDDCNSSGEHKMYNYEAYCERDEHLRTDNEICDRRTHNILHTQPFLKQTHSSAQDMKRNDVQTNSSSTTNIVARTQSPDLDDENILARPEFNSTLKITTQLQELQSAKLDIKGAVNSKLKSSANTRSKITEKSSARLNSGKPFEGLISLDVEQADVIESVEKQIQCTQKSVKKDVTKAQITHVPDLLEFYDVSYERDTPSVKLYTRPRQMPKLRGISQSQAFDTYRHLRVWQKLDL